MAEMRAIPDLMLCLQQLSDDTVGRIRKTAEDPPRVSVYDVLQVVTGCPAYSCSTRWQRLKDNFPEVSTPCANFKFSGRGQVATPVADVRSIAEIIMVLPGRAAAGVRKQAADILVRYLGGDASLVEEVAANRLTQEQLDEDDPARIFGQTVESEALKRKREEVTLAELDGRAKRTRVQSAVDVAGMTLRALEDLSLPVSDRDRMLAKDIITNAGFAGQAALQDRTDDKDICLQKFCAERGKAGQHISLGSKAKKLYLADHPDFTFPKKDVYANGQIIQANRWTEGMRGYLERALASM